MGERRVLTGGVDEIVEAALGGRFGAVPATGRRARRRAVKSGLGQAGFVAALLAAQGCIPIRPGGPELVAPEPEPPAPPTNDPYPVEGGKTTAIPVSALLDTQPGAVEIVGVESEHGVAHLEGDVIHFTPHEGHEGGAVLTFSWRDSAGATRRSDFELKVEPSHGEHDHDGGHDGHGPGHGDGGHDHDGEGEGEDEHDHDHGDEDGEGDGHDHGDGGHDHGSAPHPDDPSKQSEHMAMMALVPVSAATHVAVKDGSWFDPSTWANGTVPGDGAKVVIPQGVSVAYDGESPVSLFTVRIDGALDFATDRDTFMEVDTIVVAPTGRLTVGTVDDPVGAGFEAVISIADNGPIDVAWDPMLLSRGVISHGATQMHGAQKENFIKLAVDPMKGDTTLVLDGAPDGWRVGDRLVLTGTHLGSPDADSYRTNLKVTEDEELVITAIKGNVITLDRALQYDHEGPRADLKAYVANYTRNVRIESEGGDGLPVHERGHVMFMHSDNVDVRYAEFSDLGRTDKSHRAFDVADLDHVSSDSNVKARYPLHIHRSGVSNQDEPVMLVGNAVWGSPGWGIVHHDSNAIIDGNAVYNVFGAAYVAETGNETGRWADNIAIKSIGAKVLAKDGEDVTAFDQARHGVGFWFEGRLVDAVDNVAAGMPGGHGFIYMSRVPREHEIPVDPNTVLQHEKLRYVDDSPINIPNIGKFAGNEAIGVLTGFEVIKANSQQHHDVRSVIEDFTAWEVWNGVHLQYTARYTLKDLDLVATKTPVVPGQYTDSAVGVWYAQSVFDTVVNGASISGFAYGVRMKKDAINFEVDDFRYIFVDVDISGAKTLYEGLNAHDRVLAREDLIDRVVEYRSVFGDGIIDGPDHWQDPRLVLQATKVDSLGSIEVSTEWDPFYVSYHTLRGAVEQNGYWTTKDGRRVTMVEEYVADRATGEIEKTAMFVEVPSAINMTPGANLLHGVRVEPAYNGVLDESSRSPVATNDSFTVKSGQKAILDLIANDFDPDGDAIRLDGVTAPRHGHLVENADGTVSYLADQGYRGEDSFYYWVADEYGNFTKAQVTVTVDA